MFSALKVLVLIAAVACAQEEQARFFDAASSLSEAGKVVGVLASDAFDAFNAMTNYDEYAVHARQDVPERGGLLRTMLRAFGLDEKQIGEMAINVIIYLGEMLTKRFIGEDDGDEALNEIPQYRSIAQEEGVLSGLNALVMAANERAPVVKASLLDHELSDWLIDGLKNRTGDATACVQLFLCKLAPFVRGMQDFTGGEDFGGLNFARSIVYNSRRWWSGLWDSEHLPTSEDVSLLGKTCDEKYPLCPLIDFTQVAAETLSRKK